MEDVMPSGPSFAVLGFRPHTYWTAVVALAGRPKAPQVLERRKVAFAAGLERFVYHQAEEMDVAKAEALIEQVRVATVANAAREIGALVADLERDGVGVRLAVTPIGTAKLPDRLEDILKVHARMHAAEGTFYRDVVAQACEVVGLEVHRVVERELPSRVGQLLRLEPPALEARLKDMGAALGPPWSADFKLATQAAWIHLDDARSAPKRREAANPPAPA
jgi:hypothetical protein